MQPDIAARLQALFDKFKAFPEAGPRQADGAIPLKAEAFNAFLDARQLIEREVLPYVSSESRSEIERRADRTAQAIADNLNSTLRHRDEVFRRMRSANERNVHLAIGRMRHRHISIEGADGLLAFYNTMLDVMGGDFGK